MAGGLIAAALASFIVSSTVTRRAELSRGVQRLAQCDLDVSILVQSQDELGTFAKTFNDMVRQLRVRRELERHVEESRAISQAKSQFLANMSHELRTPLNAIILYSELLQEEAEDLGVEKFIPDLEKICNAGKHLLALINDVLDLSKIESGKMDLVLGDLRRAGDDPGRGDHDPAAGPAERQPAGGPLPG